jgi:AcrR family transcriptional regulator
MARPTALTRKALYDRVWSQPLSAIAADVGVSGNALAKICNRLLVPYPPRGYWTRRNRDTKPDRPPLPPAPTEQTARLTISSVRAGSRRARTRLAPEERRDQLIAIAEQLIAADGLHAATMKRIAAQAGISETQAYNYFGSHERLLVELARREFAKIRAARQIDVDSTRDHYARITRTTRTYLREIGQRGDLLQTLLSSPEVRSMLRKEHRKQQTTELRSHAQGLVELYGISRALALGCTVVLTTLCLRAGKLIADKRIDLATGEKLCLSIVVQGSRNIIDAGKDGAGRAQRL